jgi:hypothetical protein
MVHEHINNYRIFPRIIIILVMFFCNEVWIWFSGLDIPTTEQAGFASAVILAIVGVVKYYLESGANKE